MLVRLILAAAVASLIALPVRAGPEGGVKKPGPPAFLGSFDVPPERRGELIAWLKGQGYPGAFVPEGASPDTLLYRGPKAEYESALDALNRHLHPEWYAPKRPAPRKLPGGGKTDEAIFAKLDLTAKQKLQLAELQAKLKKATAAMRTAPEGPLEAGLKINREWRSGLERILTKEQLKSYHDYWSGR